MTVYYHKDALRLESVLCDEGSSKDLILASMRAKGSDVCDITLKRPITVDYILNSRKMRKGTVARIIALRIELKEYSSGECYINRVKPLMSADGEDPWWEGGGSSDFYDVSFVKTKKKKTKIIRQVKPQKVETTADVLGQEVRVGDFVYADASDSAHGYGKKFLTIGVVERMTNSSLFCKIVWINDGSTRNYALGGLKRIEPKKALKLHNEIELKLFELKLIS